jgi:DnaJ-class molecular chaperone
VGEGEREGYQGMSLYDDLGVDKSADRDTIKRAYRKKAHRHHPDRQGGDAEKFHAVQKAYDVLYDDARRAHYDRTGQDGQEDRRGELLRNLAALFMQAVASCDVEHDDIVGIVHRSINDGKVKNAAMISDLTKGIARFESAKKRLKKKAGGGEDVLTQMLDGGIIANRRGIEMCKEQNAKFDETLAVLAGYTYVAERMTGAQFVPNSFIQFKFFR